MKIAVIGSGISGLSASYFLSKKHHVDLFEKEDRFGGHSYTIDVIENKKRIPVDIGFIVFNHLTYPNLINFFNEIDIEIEKSDMSFSVSVEGTNFEYCGKGLKGIFANKSNFLNIKFIRMFLEILKFYKLCDKISNIDQVITLDEFLKKNKWSKSFINYHIIPMVSAIWSMPPYEAGKMPMNFFLKFFQNHGLFKLRNRPQWYTVAHRSKTYVNKVLSQISGEYFKNYKINSIQRVSSGVQVYYGGANEFFDYDKVILATHADQALSLIKNPTDQEIKTLSNFDYKKNLAVLHCDESVMPKNKKVWSSWNTYVDPKNLNKSSLTYWLNLLQNINCEKNIFLTLNPLKEIPNERIYKKIEFTHPYYDQKALDNQKNLKNIQNKENLLFCGSYFGYGFHEDGIKSSIEMLKNLNE
ncbi:NAD(P)-binding protein [Candidatus Pelagibacter sp.]|nr:NAD(P)-binding protein [Candidatus Pelagibacter sp.]